MFTISKQKLLTIESGVGRRIQLIKIRDGASDQGNGEIVKMGADGRKVIQAPDLRMGPAGSMPGQEYPGRIT